MNDSESGIFVSSCISAQYNVLWPQGAFLCGCSELCKELQLLVVHQNVEIWY